MTIEDRLRRLEDIEVIFSASNQLGWVDPSDICFSEVDLPNS